MEAYKSHCPSCGKTYYWTGYKTGLGKTPEQLARIHRDETVCRYCDAEGLETGVDREESEAGQLFAAQEGLFVKMLSEILSGKIRERFGEED